MVNVNVPVVWFSPEKPESEAVELRVRFSLVVRVPVPDNVPFRTRISGMVGAAPSGSEQLLPTVLVLV